MLLSDMSGYSEWLARMTEQSKAVPGDIWNYEAYDFEVLPEVYDLGCNSLYVVVKRIYGEPEPREEFIIYKDTNEGWIEGDFTDHDGPFTSLARVQWFLEVLQLLDGPESPCCGGPIGPASRCFICRRPLKILMIDAVGGPWRVRRDYIDYLENTVADLRRAKDNA